MSTYTYESQGGTVVNTGETDLKVESEFGGRDYLKRQLIESGVGLGYISMLDEYDPSREGLARGRHQEKLRGIMGQSSQNIWDIYKGQKSALGQSGFAGSGRIDKTVGRGEANIMKTAQGGIKESRLSTQGEIEGYRQSYLDNLSTQLSNLATTTGDKSGVSGTASKVKGGKFLNKGWLKRLLPWGSSGYEDAYGNEINWKDKTEYGI